MRIQIIALTLCAIVFCAAAGETTVPAASLPCFPGSYYRKAVSSMDHWTGIDGVVTLPQLDFDETRKNPTTGRFLDNPSVYLGGRAGEQEIDAGLSWEVIREANGTVSKIGKAFRPFWRNEKWQNAPARPEYYFYPGDTVRISCSTTETGQLLLQFQLVSRAEKTSTTGAAVSSRKTSDSAISSTDLLSSFSVSFPAAAFGPSKIQQFKRVNAIDQSHNERKAAQPTRTAITDATWSEVWLLRGAHRVAFVPSRYTDMRCPDPRYFEIEPAGKAGAGGEKVSIRGDGAPLSAPNDAGTSPEDSTTTK